MSANRKMLEKAINDLKEANKILETKLDELNKASKEARNAIGGNNFEITKAKTLLREEEQKEAATIKIDDLVSPNNPIHSSVMSKIKVMEAFVAGEKIESRCVGYKKWMPCECPNWDWKTTDYRVVESQGPRKEVVQKEPNNVEKLELVQRAGVMIAYANGMEIEIRQWGSSEWKTTKKPIWNWSFHDYRVKPNTECDKK